MLQKLISKYRRKGVLVDTNLLVGLMVGTLGKEHLKDCRATQVFTAEDFDLLEPDFLLVDGLVVAIGLSRRLRAIGPLNTPRQSGFLCRVTLIFPVGPGR